MNGQRFDRKWIAALFLLLALLYLAPLAGHNLLEPDEGRYAEIPREMAESGDYITPRLNYVKYFEKPVLLYWMNAASFRALGETPFAARFPSALTAVLGIFGTAALGALIYGKRTGVISAVLTGTSLLYYAIGTTNLTDMPFTFFITMSMVFFYMGYIKRDRRLYALFYAAMALGVLTKGLAAVVLPCGVIFLYALFTRKPNLLAEILYLPGIVFFFSLTVPWFYLVCRENPDFFNFFFIREHFMRYTTRIHNRYEPFWFFLPLIPAAVMPWTAFMAALCSKKSTLRSPDSPEMREANLFLSLWFAVPLLFFSFSGSKLIPYITPCVPPLVLLMSCNIDRMIKTSEWTGRVIGLSITVWLFFSAAAFSYPFWGKELSPPEGIAIAAGISTGLLGGSFFAQRFTKKRDYEKAFISLCAGAIIFTAGLQTIYLPLERTRSAWPEAKEIIAAADGGKIAVYGEVLQGLPFYTKQRIILIDYTGELKYSAGQEKEEGWFPSAEEFLTRWHGGEPLTLVIEKKRIPSLFPGGVTGAARQITTDEYQIFFNREI